MEIFLAVLSIGFAMGFSLATVRERGWKVRRPPKLEKLMAEANEALAYPEAPAAKPGVPVNPRDSVAEAKLCRDCLWGVQGLLMECRSPKQTGYDDHAGSEDWYSTAVIRKHDCHGQWWEPQTKNNWPQTLGPLNNVQSMGMNHVRK